MIEPRRHDRYLRRGLRSAQLPGGRFPDVFVTRCERHYIFYLHPEGGKPLIIAVLHERMDMLARLGHRLSA